MTRRLPLGVSAARPSIAARAHIASTVALVSCAMLATLVGCNSQSNTTGQLRLHVVQHVDRGGPISRNELIPAPGHKQVWADLRTDALTCATLGRSEQCMLFLDATGETQHMLDSGDAPWEIRQVDAPADDARTFFDPPLAAYPDQLLPGEEFLSSAAMRVTWFDEARGQRDSGKALLTLENQGHAAVRTPFGEYDATVLVTCFTADLGLARAHNRLVQYIAPGIGAVAQELHRTVRVLGITIQEKRMTFVRDPAADQVSITRDPTADEISSGAAP